MIKIVKHASLILLLNCIPFVILLNFEKPVAQKLWRQRCVRNALVLNDCNWCTCSANFRYTCDARVCREVDMFGHFNDAIQDINVGMEGHGVWRTQASACEPGVHYSREGLLCVCTEDGTWPNPVCRDTFRVLHTVEVMKNFQVSNKQTCSPTKLYLADCNVCLCPPSGYIDPSQCTKRKCTQSNVIPMRSADDVDAVYAQCKLDETYKLGCKKCICLRDNRLVCDKCTKDAQCESRKPGENFNVNCNTCHCDDKGTLYCTINRCLDSQEEIKILKYSPVQFLSLRKPVNKIDCEPGTKFKRGCNTCYCFQKKGKIKKYACTLKQCSGEDTQDCEIGDKFTKPCELCHCGFIKGQKMEVCESDPECRKYDRHSLRNSLRNRGYTVKQDCKPMEVYQKGCNTCWCLPNGKIIRCKDEPCEAKPISMDIIPVVQNLPDCPTGHSYKVDCNFCYCLSSGNAVCTTMECKDNKELF